MFDYFDWLTVQKGDTLGYEECLGLEHQDFPRPTASSQYLILTSLEGESVPSSTSCQVGDPFFDQEDANRPFLSLLIVTVLPVLETAPSDSGSQHIRPENISCFLKSCAGELRELVAQCCDGMQVKAPTDKGMPRVIFQVYHSISSGNFCIVVRSHDAAFAHSIAVRVRAAKLNKNQQFGFPAVGCSTFSLIGTVCPQDSNRWPSLGRVIGASDADVSLRMSVTNDVLNTLSQHTSCFKPIGPRGVYGRYDVTILLRMEQFGQLYPWICAHKLGRHLKSADKDNTLDQGVVPLLQNVLSDQGVQHINSRLLLMDITGGNIASDGKDWRQKLQKQVREENAKVSEFLRKIAAEDNGLLYCQEEYQTCLKLLSDLWEGYSSLRYQDDSFIEGNMLLAQMSLLLKIIHNYLESIPKECPPRSAFQTLVICLRLAINSIDHFQKLMLSVNQQSIQAPNYEIQMHTDMEKFVVAYTEFSRRFLAEHFIGVPGGGKASLSNARQLIFPIITVNVTLEAIQASPLFLLPYKPITDELMGSNDRQEYILLSIEMPDNSFFGDIYAVLPLIAHELFHNFRVLDRETRNNDLAKFLLHKIAQMVVRNWMSLESGTGFYHPFGRLENELFIDNLAELLYRAYAEQCRSAHQTANIGVLLVNIKSFLAKYIFTQRSTNLLQRPGLSFPQVRDQMNRLCRLALDASDTETPSWIGQYQHCFTLLEKAEKGNAVDRKLFGEALETLVPMLTSEVRRGHLNRIDRSGQVFCSMLASKGGTEKYDAEIQTRLDYFRKSLTADSSLDFCSAAQVDRWIGEVDQERAALNEQVKMAASVHEGIPDALIHAAKDLDYAICALCRAVKDANHLSQLLFGFFQEEADSNQDIREKLIKDYHAKIRLDLDQYCSDNSTCGLLYSAPMIREITVPLGVDLENEVLFVQSMKRTLFYTNRKDTDYILDHSTTLYREAFADLGMCISLGLTPFGYLNVLAHNEFFQNTNDIPSNMREERMSLVCSALLDPDGGRKRMKNEAFTELQQECICYANELAEHLDLNTLPEAKIENVWTALWATIKDLLKCRYYECGLPSFQLTKRDFNGWLKPEVPQETRQELYRQLQSLWYLANLFNHLAADIDAQKEHTLLDRFRELLTYSRQEWQKEWGSSPESFIQAKVGRTYNCPEQLSLFLNRSERFKDTLTFIMHYYYHGWSVYGCRSRADINIWLDTLMGGMPNE